MPSPRLLGCLSGGAALLATSMSYAQCAKDTDCKSDRVCEAGKCVAPAVAPAVPVAARPAAAPPSAQVAPAAASEPVEDTPVKMQRHSTGMMVGGIVMLSLAPVALLVSGIARIGKGICDIDDERGCDQDYDPTIYGSLLTGVALIGVGVPLLVIGAKKEPVEDLAAIATVSPWATAEAAGIGVRIDL
jgi:hypothetical protein